MSADRLFQYQGLVEPFDAALAEAVVTIDSWYVEPADILRRPRRWPPSQFTAPFTPTLPPPPAAPDLGWMIPQPAPLRARPRPRGGMVEPVFPIPTVPPNTIAQWLIPPLGPTEQSWHRLRHVVDRLTNILNSLIRQGFLVPTSNGVWTYDLTSAMVTDALGFTPGENDAYNIQTITSSGFTALVTTVANHGLIGNEAITIAGSSLAGYDGDWIVEYVGVNQFKLITTSMGVLTYIGDATGGTWRIT